MPFVLEFEKKENYQSLKTGITIDVILRYGNRRHDCSAKVDTGSDACLFEREIADILEIDVESGYREKFGTLTNDLTAYQHEIEVMILRKSVFKGFARRCAERLCLSELDATFFAALPPFEA